MGRALWCCMVFVPLLVAAEVAADVPDWTPLGPEGGNLVAVAFDPDQPDTAYAVGGYGLYKRSGRDAPWQRLTVGGSVFSLAVASGGYVYVGGLGAVFRSRDHGATFEARGAFEPGTIEALAIDPGNPLVVYAADVFIGAPSSALHVYRSADGGETWTRESSALPPSDVVGLAVDPVQPAVVYAALARDGLFVSTDAGVTWGAANDGLPCPQVDQYGNSIECLSSFSLLPDAAGTMLAGTYDFGLFRRDRSATWTPSNQGLGVYNVTALAMDPGAHSMLYAGAASERFVGSNYWSILHDVFRSDDGGLTWRPGGTLLPARIAALAVDPHDSADVYAATGDAHGGDGSGLFRSPNGAATWRPDQAGLTATCMIKLAAAGTRPATLYAAPRDERTKLYIGADAGTDWRDAGLFTSDWELAGLAVDPNDPLRGYAATPYDGLFATVDGGDAWTQLQTVTLLGLSDFAVDARDGATLYTAVLGDVVDGGVERSDDGGLSWTTVHQATAESGQIRALAVDDASGAVYALYEHAIFRSRDGRTDWTQLAGTPAAEYYWKIRVAPTSPATLLLVTDDRLWISRDAGRTWQDSALPERFVFAVAVDPARAQTLYASGRGQLYRSDDAGRTWTPLGREVAGTGIYDLAVDPNERAVVYAATCGAGVQRLEQETSPAPGASGGSGCAIGGRPQVSEVGLVVFLIALAAASWRTAVGRPSRPPAGGTPAPLP